MLTKCPECELQVSDKAASCPHCGFPLKGSAKSSKYKKPNRRRRLPNGFGQISEIKNRNLRKPFRAMITVGKNEYGKPICKPLKPVSYFETYNDAYSALVEYNKDPSERDAELTVKELYGRWFPEYSATVAPGTANAIDRAWKYCVSVHDMLVKDLRVRHIKNCMDNGTRILKGYETEAVPSMKNQIKTLFNQMLDYAVEYEIVEHNYARNFKLNGEVLKKLSTVQNEHLVFSDDEMKVLWDHIQDSPFAGVMIIQCYTGWRPQEMCLLSVDNVDLERGIIKGGMKTESGENRIVPIHSKIKGLVTLAYDKAITLGSPYLFNYLSPSFQPYLFWRQP